MTNTNLATLAANFAILGLVAAIATTRTLSPFSNFKFRRITIAAFEARYYSPDDEIYGDVCRRAHARLSSRATRHDLMAIAAEVRPDHAYEILGNTAGPAAGLGGVVRL